MNRLFVASKPMFMGSNQYLGRIKRQYGVKSAGFTGILDPFAKGVLTVGFGQYTKFFRFLAKTPKRYKAVLWLGCESDTLDIEGVTNVQALKPFSPERVEAAVLSIKGKQLQTPPKYSAKKIGGVKAYEIARTGGEPPLKPVEIEVFDVQFHHYRHPFVTFEVAVSEGTYVRSLGKSVAAKLYVPGSLSYLERMAEGRLVYDGEKPLDPLAFIDAPRNSYRGDPTDLEYGRKLDRSLLEKQELGIYVLPWSDKITMIEITEEKVKYLLNGIQRNTDAPA